MNLEDHILTIENVLPADEYYELLDYCESTNDFERKVKDTPEDLVDTFHQRGQRYDIQLESGRIHEIVREAFLYGLRGAYDYYGYLLPNIYRKVSGYWLLKYEEGDFLTCHSDFQAEAGSITMSYIINDDYEGGDMIFWKGYKMNNKRNSLHIFPSSFIFPHEVTPVTKGTRYSAITWFGHEFVHRQGIDI